MRLLNSLIYPGACLLALAAPLASTANASNSITADQRDFFEAKIRPVLIAECYECHAGKEAKGGLLLDSRPNIMAGGDNGSLIIPGNADGSLLIESLKHSHADSDLHMPKNGAKLEDSIIQDFVKWIEMGAPDPRDSVEAVAVGAGTWDEAYALRSKWWSFQPVKRHAIDQKDKHPVDYWIDKTLSEKGLERNPQAEKFLRLRRLSYALTGLPPSTEELHQFVNDASPKAWENAVDRYLASSAYGERWARHWMDLMRYAESHGSEGDPVIPFAWRYRDHLIRSFNSDVPYDQMVREHVAGDLLPKPRWNHELKLNESLLATANLRLAEHGFQPVDSLDEQVKTVDNQVEVLTKSFLGLTVSCARCHDHKFDAISQNDYTALYGIFASTRPGQVTLDSPELLNLHKDALVELKEDIKQALAKEWLQQAEELPDQLKALGHSPEMTDQRLASLRTALRTQVLKQRSHEQGINEDMPVAISRWDFEDGGNDLVGNLDAELLDGATINNGRLVLDGVSAYARTPALNKSVSSKTLEAWVQLADLEQRGGGVLSVERNNGAVFDSIVYGEKVAGEWISGSDNHHRTARTEGPAEIQSELVHLVVTYDATGKVSLYRNGVAYGQPYQLDKELPEFETGSARLLLGKRHTGGGRAYLKGEIEEAALYDHALTERQVAALYSQGLRKATDEELIVIMSEPQKNDYAHLKKTENQQLQKKAPAELKVIFDKASKNSNMVLHPWAKLLQEDEHSIKQKWNCLAEEWQKEVQKRQQYNQEHFVKLWDLTSGDYSKWTHTGNGLNDLASRPGEFVIQADGDQLLDGILPAGVYSHLLSSKHAALLVSPYFNLEGDALSVRFTGNQGGGLRIMIDNYPLGNNETYPQVRPDGGDMRWFRLDTSYRKGSKAYVEMATYGELTRPRLNDGAVDKKDAGPDKGGRSWFGISKVYLNKTADKTPQEELLPVTALFKGESSESLDQLALSYKNTLIACIQAWRENKLSDEQQSFLNEFVSGGVLKTKLDEVTPETLSLVQRYRTLEKEVPAARRAPGPVEADGFDAPFMTRGNHLQLEDPVPRRFLQVLGGNEHYKKGSGRLELADAMTDTEKNALFSRVMVNRVWHWLFGRGLVSTVDNFGRLGEKPTHPELLDWLALKFKEDGYSIKKLIRLMVTSETWQQGHLASDKAREVDASNQYWSYMPVKRLEAEAIRDSMLQVSGVLNHEMYGEPREDKQYARSIYLAERRNRPHPFLEVFDRPKPATTRGQRDATNIPAQSLSMMNDVFVRHLATRWARQVITLKGSTDTDVQSQRVKLVYENAFSRQPTDLELSFAAEYLDGKDDESAWADYLQALFASKEFIYLR